MKWRFATFLAKFQRRNLTMALSTEKAAETLVYYIKLALEAAGQPVSNDMRAELTEAVEAFRVTESVKPNLWAVDVNDGIDCRPMPNQMAATDFVRRHQGKAGVKLKVIPWPGSADAHSNILALEAALVGRTNL